MALQYSVPVNNARLDTVESVTGTSAKLRIYTGVPPVNCAAASSGTLLTDIALPSDWMSGAVAGVKSKLGTWSGVGIAAGVAGHFRITDTAGTTAHMQGTCGQGSGDMSLDNTNIAVSQVIAVNSFSLTSANI